MDGSAHARGCARLILDRTIEVRMVATGQRERNWIDAPDGYAVALDGSRVVARSPRGVELKALPATLKDAPVVRQLREVREWLGRHERECTTTVEAWMVR